MTVGQLIAALQKMDQQAEVKLYCYDEDRLHNLHTIIDHINTAGSVILYPIYPTTPD